MKKTILIIATLDTKGAAVKYIKELVEATGYNTIVMDVGIVGETPLKAEISRDRVARAGMAEISQLASRRRDLAIKAMAQGAAKVAKELCSKGKFNGVIAIGGNQGTMIATTAMKALPIGMPKVMLSTVASGNVRPYVGSSDIVMMFSVTDTLGSVDTVSKTILSNAAGAVLGMCELGVKMPTSIGKKLIGITSFGATDAAASKASEVLRKKGYEPVVFHASGAGGSAMEDLIAEEIISGVLDLTPHELVAEIFPEACDVYAPVIPGRLEAAGRRGIAQVIAPGGLDYFVYGPPETIPPKYGDRKVHYHNPYNANVRTSGGELEIVGKVMAKRLKKSKGPVAVMIPLKGWSERSRKGAPLYDPDADKMFVQSLKKHAGDAIPVLELDCYINDPEFAEKAVEILDNFMKLAGGW